MFSAKDAQTMARATQRRGSLAHRQNRRRKNGGQSLIVAIIVLFILLFLGGVFIALIANNLRNTRRGVQVSAANKFAEAGIKYLDQQLMTSPEGADWRSTPRCLPTDNCLVTTAPKYLNPQDPDYFWLKPYDPASGEGGFTRVVFGGPTASQSNLGGRALVRISYRPYRTTLDASGATVYWDDENGNGTFQDPAERVTATDADRTRRYLQLESIGRVGIVDELDPTTYRNSEGLGLRRELVAYKALGLTESLRFITDKDKRRVAATLGAPYPVRDRDVPRNIYNVYQGAIRSNTDLTFYGMNYLSLDPRRGDALEVAGTLGLNGLPANLTTPTGADVTKVYITDGQSVQLPLTPVAPLVPVSTLGAAQTGNVFPSGSGAFTTLNGLIRDNPRGNETQDLPDAAQNNNLRAVSRLDPPLMDAVTGDSGLTRYRALTRDSARMPVAQTGNGAGAAVLIDNRYAGAYGWGQNLYIPNAIDLQSYSESASNVSSLRAEWLNPSQANTVGANWSTDSIYTPPAVTITLTPRYMALTQSRNASGRGRSYLRRPSDGSAIRDETVYRYTYEAGGPLINPPTFGIDDTDGNAATPPSGPAEKYAGYPAVRTAAGYYDGDFIIFAEGNIRIKGTVGGYDPETGQTFVRRLTVVTNGTVYFDGSLLRDNISPGLATGNAVRSAAKGKSTIAVLAKNYAAVNTTQFLATTAPAAVFKEAQQREFGQPTVIQLKNDTASTREQKFGLTLGPVITYDTNGLPFIANVYNAAPAVDMNQTPSYLNTPDSLSLLMRHAPANDEAAAVNLFINTFLAAGRIDKNRFEAWGNGAGEDPYPLVLGDKGKTPAETSLYTSNVYFLNSLPGVANFLFPTNGFPYTGNGGGTAATMPAVGISNNLTLEFDNAKSKVDYNLSRFGVVPLDVRIEALIYAQEGSFFIIPGPWFNPNPNDTYTQFLAAGNKRPAEPAVPPATEGPSLVNPAFPFYNEPLDIRITMFGAITENLPAEIGDQGAWLQKWGWIPKFYGSTGLAGTPTQGVPRPTFHGSSDVSGVYLQNGGVNDGVGNGITYIYDPRLSSPYDAFGIPLRSNPNFFGLPNTQGESLPPMPRLPVAPGLLYYG
ncbi:MAG: hypothetical protein H8F28_08350, partial [Fibrella sp.]|nr:hypothetical protein [Armatimonadota bacterium]